MDIATAADHDAALELTMGTPHDAFRYEFERSRSFDEFATITRASRPVRHWMRLSRSTVPRATPPYRTRDNAGNFRPPNNGIPRPALRAAAHASVISHK